MIETDKDGNKTYKGSQQQLEKFAPSNGKYKIEIKRKPLIEGGGEQQETKKVHIKKPSANKVGQGKDDNIVYRTIKVAPAK